MALLTSALTTAAATGIMIFGFQDGHLASLLGAATQPGIEQTDYMVLAALVFGLSTDYGVFLLTRIKEAQLLNAGADVLALVRIPPDGPRACCPPTSGSASSKVTSPTPAAAARSARRD
jgi:uncharacterized membrane protein YdfJ with MMPL/SSD domain